MPELSRFHGLIIRMFMEQGERHHLPHFHVYYQEYVATYSIDPIEPLHGVLPTRQRRLLEGWAELHKEELLTIGNNYRHIYQQARLCPYVSRFMVRRESYVNWHIYS